MIKILNNTLYHLVLETQRNKMILLYYKVFPKEITKNKRNFIKKDHPCLKKVYHNLTKRLQILYLKHINLVNAHKQNLSNITSIQPFKSSNVPLKDLTRLEAWNNIVFDSLVFRPPRAKFSIIILSNKGPFISNPTLREELLAMPLPNKKSYNEKDVKPAIEYELSKVKAETMYDIIMKHGNSHIRDLIKYSNEQ